MMSGEASGLRVNDWKTAPEIPSAAPKITAASARGARHSTTTIRAKAAAGAPTIAPHTSATLSG